MKKIKKIFVTIVGFVTLFTDNVFAMFVSDIPTQILYGPYNEPSLLEKVMGVFKILAIPFILIIGTVIFIVRRKKNDDENNNK